MYTCLCAVGETRVLRIRLASLPSPSLWSNIGLEKPKKKFFFPFLKNIWTGSFLLRKTSEHEHLHGLQMAVTSLVAPSLSTVTSTQGWTSPWLWAWSGPCWLIIEELLVTATFPEETQVRVWFPLRLSNFLPGLSVSQQSILLQHGTDSPVTHKAWDSALDMSG